MSSKLPNIPPDVIRLQQISQRLQSCVRPYQSIIDLQNQVSKAIAPIDAIQNLMTAATLSFDKFGSISVNCNEWVDALNSLDNKTQEKILIIASESIPSTAPEIPKIIIHYDDEETDLTKFQNKKRDFLGFTFTFGEIGLLLTNFLIRFICEWCH